MFSLLLKELTFIFYLEQRTASAYDLNYGNIGRNVLIMKASIRFYQNGNLCNGVLVSSVSSFLFVVGPFVGHVFNLFSGPSAEYQLLKRLFTQVENRFDKIDVQFAALRRQVRFVATQVHFTDLESNINAVQSELTTLSKVTNSRDYSSESQDFIATFDRTYESSGIKLFNSISSSDRGK